MKDRYQMYCVFGPTTYRQDKLHWFDYVAHILGWLDWVDLMEYQDNNLNPN